MTEMDHLIPEDNQGKRSAERKQEVQRQPAAQKSPKEHRAETLQEPQVYRAAVIDAVEGEGQLAIRLEKTVADDHLAGRHVGQLQLVARDGVADIAHVEEAALGHTVEQLLNDLAQREPLRLRLRMEADGLQRLGEQRPDLLAQPFLTVMNGRAQQNRQSTTILVADPCPRQSRGGHAQMLDQQHIRLEGHQPFDRLAEERRSPFNQVERVQVALVVNAHRLQVVEDARRRRPHAMTGGTEETAQGGQPFIGLSIVQLQRRLQAFHQSIQVVQRPLSRHVEQLRCGDIGGAQAEDGGTDDVATLAFPVGAGEELLTLCCRRQSTRQGQVFSLFVGWHVLPIVRIHHRIGRTVEARLLEQLPRINQLSEDRLNPAEVLHRREVARRQWPSEVTQLKKERNKLRKSNMQIIGG